MGALLTLPNLLAAITVLALNGYVLLGGADFGGGIWDLFASGPRKPQQRELVAHAIGPIWEANHVWLILAVVLLFTCFPPAFALLGIALHIPLSLMLIGIVLRGSAFTFRANESVHSDVQSRWGRVFSIASVATPVLLGVCLGAIASERVGGNASLVACANPEHAATCGAASFSVLYLRPWLSAFPIAVGVLTLALFAFLAAVYLTVEAERDVALQEDFRRRALFAAAALFVAAFGALIVTHYDAPRMQALMWSWLAVPVQLLTAAAAVTAIGCVWTRRYRVARVAAAAQVSCIVWGWALVQYPYIVPPELTISSAAAPPATLRLALIALGAGAVILFPSLAYLFRVFKSADPTSR